MFTADLFGKSYIQVQSELIEERGKFANDISKILENYKIEDGVFGVLNNNTYELSKGYFVEEKTFDTISDLIKEMDQRKQAVRITEGKFILGNVYANLSDVDTDKKIFSIEYLDFI